MADKNRVQVAVSLACFFSHPPSKYIYICVYIYKRNEKYRASKLYTMMIFLSFGAPHTLTHIHHIHQAQFRQFLDMYRFFFFQHRLLLNIPLRFYFIISRDSPLLCNTPFYNRYCSPLQNIKYFTSRDKWRRGPSEEGNNFENRRLYLIRWTQYIVLARGIDDSFPSLSSFFFRSEPFFFFFLIVTQFRRIKFYQKSR